MNNIIDIELNNKSDYKNKFNNNRISNELNTYILNEVKALTLKDKIILEMDNKVKLSEEEQTELVKMIKLSFKDDLDELKIYERRLLNQSLILLIIGVILLLAYYFAINVFFVSEFILIIGWLFIWEAGDLFLFTRRENQIKQIRREQLIHSKIIFK